MPGDWMIELHPKNVMAHSESESTLFTKFLQDKQGNEFGLSPSLGTF